jgi:hypothetical protein
MTVRNLSKPLIYGGVGLTIFGVAYDSGLLGPTDGHDHSVVFSSATSTVSISAGSLVMPNTVTGDEVVAPLPNRKPSQHQT